MKKLFNYAMYAISIMMMVSLNSCCEVDDEMQAMVLSGEWHGDFGMSYIYEDARGREYCFDAVDTRIVFYPEYNHALWGHGRQTDFYEDGPYESQTYHFDWRVRDGVIYLTYPYDPTLDCNISDYHMSNDHFSGHFYHNSPRFMLHKVEDYYDWSPYVNVYHNECNSSWYEYDCTRSVDAPADAGGKVKARFNRLSVEK